MTVIVDTCIWSLLLRRPRPESADALELSRLLPTGSVVLPGPVRQELLSGIPNAAQFEKLRERLAEFPDYPLRLSHYLLAAELTNDCVRRGIQGSPTDFLLCAVCQEDGHQLYTSDRDFEHFATVFALNRYVPAG